MKKIVLLLCLLAGAPLMAEAAVGIDIRSPGVSIHLGDRDTRGYYWDGYDWRAPRWWHDHQNRHWGERGPRGDYWNGRGWQRHPPVRRPPPPPRPAYHHAPRDRRSIVRSHTTVRRRTTTADRRAEIALISRGRHSRVTVTNHQEPAKLALSFC
ncbi:DUF2502 domain-containing protein [Erwinia aphidicola]|uniref:DUF2502 domain-containing protein n=1 Tax=Erwinia aphidicola TaxID=68334 RepID=UPI0030D2140B